MLVKAARSSSKSFPTTPASRKHLHISIRCADVPEIAFHESHRDSTVFRHKVGGRHMSRRPPKPGRRTAEGEMLLAEATGYAAGVRRAVFTLCAAVLAATAVGVWASPLAAQASQDAQTLAEQAIRRLDLQTELLRQPEPFGLNLSLPPEILWAVVVVGAGVLLYAFRDMIPMLRATHGGTWAEDEAGTSDMGAREPEAVLGAADDLAAQGRFVEAMHVLLLQAFAEIRRRLDEQFADSMTSREILRSNRLSDDLRRPLREVVNRVEWTYFGEHPAARDDYLACRSSFSALAHALHGSAAA
jgi:hypothetical protein